MKRLFILRYFVLLVIGSAQATVINVPTDQPTIQAGIDAAHDGDTVLVSPQVYVENIDFLGKSIVVKSDDGPFVTTIQAPDSGSVVTFSSGERNSSILEGFTLTHGWGTRDVDPHNPQLMALFGGGIFIKGSSPTINANIIIDNHVHGFCSNRGGGIAIRDFSDPIITNNTITSNSVYDDCDWINYFGGGIWVDSTSKPIIGGGQGVGNNIFANFADYGRQLLRRGAGAVINAQYNYFGVCPPTGLDVYPLDQFDVSNCLDTLAAGVEDHHISMPADFAVHQNYPNPFNPTTSFSFRLPEPSFVKITIYNVKGQMVETLVNETMGPGSHRIRWNATDRGSGIYFYRITAGEHEAIGECLLLK